MHSCNYTHACKLNMPRSQRETYITDGKHASLVIYVRRNTHPWETHITVTPSFQKTHADCCIATVIPSNEEDEEESNFRGARASVDPATLQVSFVLQSYTLCNLQLYQPKIINAVMVVKQFSNNTIYS